MDYHIFLAVQDKEIDVLVKLGVDDEFVDGPNVGKDPKKFIYEPNFLYGNFE